MHWTDINPMSWFRRARQSDPAQPEKTWRNVVSARPGAGVFVTEDTALTYSAVWAAVRIISESIAVVPWQLFERQGDGRRRRDDLELDWILCTRPNTEMSAFEFRRTMQTWALTWGNGYAEIERDGARRVVNLWPLDPSRVEPQRDGSGQVVYAVKSDPFDQDPIIVQAADMFHVHGMGFDGLSGYSVIKMAQEAVSMGLAVERFGGTWFGNGSRPSGVLQHPHKMTKEARESLADAWKEAHGGKQGNRTAVLEQGTEWKPISVPPNDAQFLQTRQFQVQEIARWYRVPLHMLADLEHAHYNNIESAGAAFVRETLAPWATTWEQEAHRKLIGQGNRRKLFTRLNLNGLMRGDSKARGDYYQKMFNMGVFSINEIRALEELNPIGDEGDQRLVQVNLTTLEKVGEDPTPAPAPAPVPEDDQDPDDPDERQIDILKLGATRQLTAILARICTAEGAQSKRAATAHNGEFAKWMDTWLAKKRPDVIAALQPPITALAESLAAARGNYDVGPLAVAAEGWSNMMADQWMDQTRDDLDRGYEAGDVAGLVDLWAAERPALAATSITETIAGQTLAMLGASDE